MLQSLETVRASDATDTARLVLEQELRTELAHEKELRKGAFEEVVELHETIGSLQEEVTALTLAANSYKIYSENENEEDEE